MPSSKVERHRPIFEGQVAEFLRSNGFDYVTVRKPAQRLGRGVFGGLPLCELVVTARDHHSDFDMIDNARASALLTGKATAATVRRRQGASIGQSIISLSLSDFALLMRAAT